MGECWFNLGNALFNLNRYEEALDSFRKAQEYDLDEKLETKVLYS